MFLSNNTFKYWIVSCSLLTSVQSAGTKKGNGICEISQIVCFCATHVSLYSLCSAYWTCSFKTNSKFYFIHALYRYGPFLSSHSVLIYVIQNVSNSLANFLPHTLLIYTLLICLLIRLRVWLRIQIPIQLIWCHTPFLSIDYSLTYR